MKRMSHLRNYLVEVASRAVEKTSEPLVVEKRIFAPVLWIGLAFVALLPQTAIAENANSAAEKAVSVCREALASGKKLTSSFQASDFVTPKGKQARLAAEYWVYRRWIDNYVHLGELPDKSTFDDTVNQIASDLLNLEANEPNFGVFLHRSVGSILVTADDKNKGCTVAHFSSSLVSALSTIGFGDTDPKPADGIVSDFDLITETVFVAEEDFDQYPLTLRQIIPKAGARAAFNRDYIISTWSNY